MTVNDLLLSVLALSLIIWVGGAITGQIWMLRAGRQGDTQTRAILVPQINWIIRRIYIPAAATAFTSGMGFAWINGIPFTTLWILFPIIVFVTTVVIGSFYSLPEYSRLVALLDMGNVDDVQVQRRIDVAAWVNRIELFFVLIGIVGIIVQPQF